jgi:predicted nucleotidyltransferase
MKELNEFLESKTFPGNLIFSKVWGSRSHDCAKETSDWDFSGVYVVPTKQVLGMYGFPDTEDNPKGSKPDYSFHEVGKFCTLLIKG